MSPQLTAEEIDELRENTGKDIQRILRELDSSVPGINEELGAITGAVIGGSSSLAILSSLGVSGLTRIGISSGLSAAGSFVGGSALAGIGVLATPVAVLGMAIYSGCKYKKSRKQKIFIQCAIDKLYDILKKIVVYDEYLIHEIEFINGCIRSLQNRI